MHAPKYVLSAQKVGCHLEGRMGLQDGVGRLGGCPHGKTRRFVKGVFPHSLVHFLVLTMLVICPLPHHYVCAHTHLTGVGRRVFWEVYD